RSTPVQVGILPMGTANRLAKNLGIPSNFEKSLDIALTGRPIPLDVGRFNGRPFILGAGVGVDGRIMKQTDQTWSKKHLGMLSYFLKGTREMLRPGVTEFEVEGDGGIVEQRGLGVLVMNTRDLLGKFTLTPDARSDDGVFDVVILAVRGVKSFLKALRQVA